MTRPIFKIAKRGGDALVDADKDLAFTIDKACMIELLSGAKTITGTVEITHGLGYIPSYFVFTKGRNFADTEDAWYVKFLGTRVDSTKLYIDLYEGETSEDIFYIIYGNRQDNLVGDGNSNVVGRLRVAKPGYDAESETDVRNMIFISGKNVTKIDENLSGSVTRTIATDDFTVIEIEHNIGYFPICYVINSTFGQTLPIAEPIQFDYYVTTTKLVINVADFSEEAPYSCTFKYKITRDKIA